MKSLHCSLFIAFIHRFSHHTHEFGSIEANTLITKLISTPITILSIATDRKNYWRIFTEQARSSFDWRECIRSYLLDGTFQWSLSMEPLCNSVYVWISQRIFRILSSDALAVKRLYAIAFIRRLTSDNSQLVNCTSLHIMKFKLFIMREFDDLPKCSSTYCYLYFVGLNFVGLKFSDLQVY